MSLLTHQDLEQQKNIALTDPAGQELADKLAAGILSWAQNKVGFAFDRGERQDFFEQGGSEFWLSTPYLVEEVTVATWDWVSESYTAYTGTLRFDDHRVKTANVLPSGFQAVRISYQAGWTAEDFRATDLHQALTELLALKWDSATSGGKDLKRVRSGSYEEEFFHDPTHTPADVMEVVGRYKRPIVL